MFFVNALKGAHDWWRYALGLLVVVIGYNIGQVPLFLALSRGASENEAIGEDYLKEFVANPDFSVFGINANMGLILMLSMFVFAFLALYAIFKLLHQRPFKTLITWELKYNWKKIIFAFGFWMILGLVFEAFFYFQNPDAFTFSYRWEGFIPLVIIAILILPIQTSFEEIFFRGYIMQGLAVLLKNKWIPWIISSVLFGLVHSMNAEIAQYGYGIMMSYYIFAGLLLGFMTIMDDSLELALGVHAATNFIGAVFVGYEGSTLQTESLFKASEVNPQLMLLVLVVSGLIFLFVCSRIYKWPSINTIFKPLKMEREEIL